MAYTLSSIGNSFAAQQRPAARASRRAGAVRVQAQSDKGEDTVYLGKGRTIKDDPTKYPDRDSIGVGGWAGGEKQLKEWAAVPFSPLDPKLRKALDDYTEKKDAEGNIYLGKGRKITDDPAKYPDRDWLGVGGWAGGEVGLKEAKTLELKPGTRVRVKGEPAEWKKNGIFSGNPSFRFAGELAEVRAVRIKGGKVQVALTIDGDNSPPGDISEDVEWKKTIVMGANDIEVL